MICCLMSCNYLNLRTVSVCVSIQGSSEFFFGQIGLEKFQHTVCMLACLLNFVDRFIFTHTMIENRDQIKKLNVQNFIHFTQHQFRRSLGMLYQSYHIIWNVLILQSHNTKQNFPESDKCPSIKLHNRINKIELELLFKQLKCRVCKSKKNTKIISIFRCESISRFGV